MLTGLVCGDDNCVGPFFFYNDDCCGDPVCNFPEFELSVEIFLPSDKCFVAVSCAGHTNIVEAVQDGPKVQIVMVLNKKLHLRWM